MLRSCFLLLSIVAGQLIMAQDLYKPRDIQQAYKNGTRSLDGKPGANYWQNRARYDIRLAAAPPDRTVRGSEDITYFNNSPKAMRNLVFRLTVNIHKPGAPRLSGVPDDYLTSGVHIDSVFVNGTPVKWNTGNYFTAAPLGLPSPLASRDSIRLHIKWHYDVSLLSNREGMIDSTTYFLAYSYPRVSVYDDYQGWDFTSFNDALEFYNDFNDYNVQVQVPQNYIVWATGTLQNANEVLQPAAYQKFTQSLRSNDVIRIATPAELAAKTVTAAKGTNTWHFTAANVPDFAIGLSDHFSWDAGSVVVDPSTGRRASVQAAYNDTARDYHHMVRFASHALSWLSTQWPGIPYPYTTMSVFQGYAGMEYPMMANDETYADSSFSKFVVMHEIAHTYMPFYMGINETRYGFMDEGWATTFEYLFNRDDMGKEQAIDFFKQFRVTGWASDPSQDEDLPIITPGPNLNGGGLGNNQYGKPALGYLAVKELLGDATFKKALHEYMRRWNGKHPLPWDFFYSINAGSGQNLNWFWNNWFFSNYYIDLAVASAPKTSTGYSIPVQNIGGMAAPFDLVLTYADGSTETLHQSPAVWAANQKQTTVKVNTKKTLQSVKIEGGIYMDADTSNNEWKK